MPNPYLNATILEFLELVSVDAQDAVIGTPTLNQSLQDIVTALQGLTITMSAADILTLLLTVDGAGSGLDADLLDGINSDKFVRNDVVNTQSVAEAVHLARSGASNHYIELSNTGDIVARFYLVDAVGAIMQTRDDNLGTTLRDFRVESDRLTTNGKTVLAARVNDFGSHSAFILWEGDVDGTKQVIADYPGSNLAVVCHSCVYGGTFYDALSQTVIAQPPGTSSIAIYDHAPTVFRLQLDDGEISVQRVSGSGTFTVSLQLLVQHKP